jgi:hypothetical protein
VSRGGALLKNADGRASSNAGELVSKNAVAGSRPLLAAADSKAGPARGKDNQAPTCREAAASAGAPGEAAERPAAERLAAVVPDSADAADTGGRRMRELRLPRFRRNNGGAGRCLRCEPLLQPLRGLRTTELR